MKLENRDGKLVRKKKKTMANKHKKVIDVVFIKSRNYICLKCWLQSLYFDKIYLFTPPRNRGGVIFSLQFVCVSVCLCVCVCVCVSGTSCEQNSSRTDPPIWTRFSLNGCFPHWLRPYWIWWPWVKGQGHSDVIPVFSS